MTTIFFGPLRTAADARQENVKPGSVKPVAFVCCSAIIVCHIVDRRRVTKP
ncbi:hypothetical protein LRS73_10370 [Methylobacterium currus]|uniref:hypothetical protein n=1 Tax=Methylobacterium currus TaxID=2051553 RepID=UPI0013DED569|nr:hypothetical protein [Methylobacterium currus]UHC18206.1 hypothetical protein LRS73_10370 [Methylobacterium currus]